MSGVFLNGGCEVGAWIALEKPESWDPCQGELLAGHGTGQRERSVLQSTQLDGVGDRKSILTSDMEVRSSEFAQLVFSLALVQDFLNMIPSLHFGKVTYILCHYMWEI